MSVWFAIPSKRPPAEAEKVLRLWRERGYKIALFRDVGDDVIACDRFICRRDYPGYAVAVNTLVKDILDRDPEAGWIVTGGDDVEPDLAHTAEEIAAQCEAHFHGTFGVMQPTGDRWGDDARSRRKYGEDRGAYIDRICGSPWLGRAFCERTYGGNGPFWPGYTHMFPDEELQEVATKLGVLWQRRDLIHTHRHWGRKENATTADIPAFLAAVNTPEHWKTASELFQSRKAAGFPGHEPLVKEASHA